MIIVLLLACTESKQPITEIGNPEMTVTERGISSQPAWIGAEGARIEIQAVRVELGDVRFERCDGSEPAVFPGPRSVDLVGGSGSTTRRITEGEACGVEVVIESVLVEGLNAQGDVFELAHGLSATASASTPLAYRLEPGETDLLLAFDLAVWFEGVALDGPADPDGIVRIGGQPFAQKLGAVLMTADEDGDGEADPEELEAALVSSLPVLADTDGDDLTDVNEVQVHGTDPDQADSDGDRLDDGDEVLVHGTDPTLLDTDGGGVDDGTEISNGTDPLDPADDV